MSRQILILLAAACLAPPLQAMEWVGTDLDGELCRGKSTGFGPFDYFDVDEPTDSKYNEGRAWEADFRHLGAGINSLNSPSFGIVQFNRAGDEFDYMLRAYPNHPRALQALIQLELKRRQLWDTGQLRLRSTFPPPECYLQRAAAFRPKQIHIRLLFAMYLHRIRAMEEALQQYKVALSLSPDSAEAHYNIGLAYFQMGDHEKSLEHAKKAYAEGYPLAGLRHKLERVNAWN